MAPWAGLGIICGLLVHLSRSAALPLGCSKEAKMCLVASSLQGDRARMSVVSESLAAQGSTALPMAASGRVQLYLLFTGFPPAAGLDQGSQMPADRSGSAQGRTPARN